MMMRFETDGRATLLEDDGHTVIALLPSQIIPATIDYRHGVPNEETRWFEDLVAELRSDQTTIAWNADGTRYTVTRRDLPNDGSRW